MKVKGHLTLDAVLIGEPFELELEPGAEPVRASARFGPVADEISKRAQGLGVDFPLEATAIGVELEVIE